MNRKAKQTDEQELTDRFWRAITAIQAIHNRLLAQYERSSRGQRDDLYHPIRLTPDRAS